MRTWVLPLGDAAFTNGHGGGSSSPQTIQLHSTQSARTVLSSSSVKHVLSRNYLYGITLRSALPSKISFYDRDMLNQAIRVDKPSERHSFVDSTEPRTVHKKCRTRGGYSACAEESVSCTTFNILAPIYKRLNGEGGRESEYREYWVRRNQRILDLLLLKRSSVICLQSNGFFIEEDKQHASQILGCTRSPVVRPKSRRSKEFWVRNEELVGMYQHHLRDAGYDIYTLGRTNNRGDGLLTAVRKDHFKVVNIQELLFNDFGDRVAQLLHLQSVIPFLQSPTEGIRLETLIVNTHLLFPHNSNFCLARLRQVYKILEYLETFKADYKLPPIPIILCGDWNGSKRGHVYKFLRSQGFISSYDTAHQYTDCDVDAHRWVSHRNHRGNVCGVDFIWLLNPNKHRKPLRTSWMEAVFGIIKSKLQEAGLENLEAFSFFKSEDRFDDHVTLSEFEHALQQLGLTEQLSEGLTSEEIEDLMVAADIDGNGIIDNEEFQKMMVAQSIELCPISILEGNTAASEKWLAPYFAGVAMGERSFEKIDCSATTLEHDRGLLLKHKMWSEPGAPQLESEVNSEVQDPDNMQESDIGFDVKGASLFPPEVEQGIWPENYFLSDHAPLTAIFAPVTIPRRQEAIF